MDPGQDVRVEGASHFSSLNVMMAEDDHDGNDSQPTQRVRRTRPSAEHSQG